MQRITYRITTLSPVLITTNVGDANMVATREYIPGSVLIGLFAGRYIQENSLGKEAHKDDTFYNWFLKGDLRFTNAYIISKDDNGDIKRNFPIPLTIQHEKGDEKDYYDLLYPEEDDKQTSYKDGFGRIGGESLYREHVNKSLNFHHQRDNETGTVKKEGGIFNYESIDAGQTFEGEILGETDALRELLKLFEKEEIVYAGRSRNAQYGKVKLKFMYTEPKEFISEVDGLEPNFQNDEITLTLLSNTIIYNDNGYSTTDVSDLEGSLIKELDSAVKIIKTFIKGDEVENFVSVWRLRKPSEICFKAGSCFLLEGIAADKMAKLRVLQKNGIGERRGEGFGRIVFGWQNNDKFKLGNTEKEKKARPSGAIPDKTKEIVQTIVKDLIRKSVELKALDDVKQFNIHRGLLTKSLVGRLEAMVRILGRDRFCNALNDLRKTARDKLEGCKGSSQNLYEFLMRKVITVAEMFRQTDMSEVQTFCKKIEFQPQKNDRAFEAELYRIYFETFFSAMRKELKKGEG